MKLAASKVFAFEGDVVGTTVVAVEVLVAAVTEVVFVTWAAVVAAEVEVLAVVGVGASVLLVVGKAVVLEIVGDTVEPSQTSILEQFPNNVSFLHSVETLLHAAQTQPFIAWQSVQFFASHVSAAAVIPTTISNNIPGSSTYR